MLGAECLTEAPTGAYMAQKLGQLWEKWGINRSQVHIVLRDGAKAMEKLVREAGVLDEWCLSHVLQARIYSNILMHFAVVRSARPHYAVAQSCPCPCYDVASARGESTTRFRQDESSQRYKLTWARMC